MNEKVSLLLSSFMKSLLTKDGMDRSIVISKGAVTATWRGYVGRGDSEQAAIEDLAQQFTKEIKEGR